MMKNKWKCKLSDILLKDVEEKCHVIPANVEASFLQVKTPGLQKYDTAEILN